MRKFVWLMLLFTLLLPSTTAQQDTQENLTDTARVEQILEDMTLEEKVGQMFMVNIYGKAIGERATEFIQQQHPGAVAIFGYNTDLEPASATAAFINQIQEVSTTSGAEIPMIIATDQEGGRVRRLVNDVTFFPDPLAFGATTTDEAIERVGFALGSEMRAMGINMNLAPVADLHTREDMLNQYRVMHRRTFGDDPDRVGQQVAAYSLGLAEAGVIGVIKHYPGHGGAADSHAGLPAIELDAETALAVPLRTFEVAVQNGVQAVMVGHLYYKELEPVENLPASLSPTLLGILRDDFGFDGVIMTDAMDMGALMDNYYVPDAALMFVQAGGDLFVAGPYLTWDMQRAAMQRLIDAVHNGELEESRIDESVRRILLLKARYGLLDWQAIDPSKVIENIENANSQQALIETYMDAATVVKDDSGLLPLNEGDNLAIAYPIIYQEVMNTCKIYAPNAEFYGYNFEPADWEYGIIARLGRTYDKVVIFTENAFLNPRLRDLVLPLPPEKTIVVALSIPYDLEKTPDVSTYMAMYNSIPASRTAACNVLFGLHPITGRLPVSVGDYPSGSGIDIPAKDAAKTN